MDFGKCEVCGSDAGLFYSFYYGNSKTIDYSGTPVNNTTTYELTKEGIAGAFICDKCIKKERLKAYIKYFIASIISITVMLLYIFFGHLVPSDSEILRDGLGIVVVMDGVAIICFVCKFIMSFVQKDIEYGQECAKRLKTPDLEKQGYTYFSNTNIWKR